MAWLASGPGINKRCPYVFSHMDLKQLVLGSHRWHLYKRARHQDTGNRSPRKGKRNQNEVSVKVAGERWVPTYPCARDSQT